MGYENIINNDAFSIAFSGMFVVFSGLILIAIFIMLFNKIFAEHAHKGIDERKHVNIFEEINRESITNLPDEEIIAISTALEIYFRLYAKDVSSKLTYDKRDRSDHGEVKNILSHRTTTFNRRRGNR